MVLRSDINHHGPSLDRVRIDVGGERASSLMTSGASRITWVSSKRYAVKSAAWAPSTDLNLDAKLAGAAPVQFRFTAPKNAGWVVDDFYVDPRNRG